MKKIILCFFLAMSFSLPKLNLTYAQNAAVPLTATIDLDEAGLKQALEDNNFRFYLNDLNEEQLNALKQNSLYYEKNFTVEINTEKKDKKTECKIVFMNKEALGKKILYRYFVANAINNVVFNGSPLSSDDFFNKYIYVQ